MRIHLHLVSDSTGETVHSVARACLVQFDGTQPVEHVWSMVRTRGQIADLVVSGGRRRARRAGGRGQIARGHHCRWLPQRQACNRNAVQHDPRSAAVGRQGHGGGLRLLYRRGVRARAKKRRKCRPCRFNRYSPNGRNWRRGPGDGQESIRLSRCHLATAMAGLGHQRSPSRPLHAHQKI